MEFLVVALAAIVAAAYLLLPALIRSTTVLNGHAVPVPFDPDQQPPPDIVADHFADVRAQLEPIGFEVDAHLALAGLLPNADTMLCALVRPETETACLALFILARGPNGVNEAQRSVAFANDFTTGPVRTVETTNAADAGTFPRPPEYARTVLAGMTDYRLMSLVHDAAVRRLGAGGRSRPLPDPADWPEVLHADLREEHEGYVRLGCFEPEDDRGRRRMTWRGAYLATWKQLPPVRQILARRRAAAVRRRVEDWGIVLR